MSKKCSKKKQLHGRSKLKKWKYWRWRIPLKYGFKYFGELNRRRSNFSRTLNFRKLQFTSNSLSRNTYSPENHITEKHALENTHLYKIEFAFAPVKCQKRHKSAYRDILLSGACFQFYYRPRSYKRVNAFRNTKSKFNIKSN